MYFYKPKVFELLKKNPKSPRGEYEISLKIFSKNNDCKIIYLIEVLWLDTGNADNLLQASQFVQAYQKRGFYDSMY